jgi:hypothetical protein
MPATPAVDPWNAYQSQNVPALMGLAKQNGDVTFPANPDGSRNVLGHTNNGYYFGARKPDGTFSSFAGSLTDDQARQMVQQLVAQHGGVGTAGNGLSPQQQVDYAYQANLYVKNAVDNASFGDFRGLSFEKSGRAVLSTGKDKGPTLYADKDGSLMYVNTPGADPVVYKKDASGNWHAQEIDKKTGQIKPREGELTRYERHKILPVGDALHQAAVSVAEGRPIPGPQQAQQQAPVKLQPGQERAPIQQETLAPPPSAKTPTAGAGTPQQKAAPAKGPTGGGAGGNWRNDMNAL